MKILRQNSSLPDVSIVFLDWSCRESFHSLDYIARQDVPRDRYELIWIEYYDTIAPEITEILSRNAESGEHLTVDTWIIMDVPRNVYYHKHYMYNVGIAAARGKIICFCDSDAMFTPSFVRSMIDFFDAHPGTVLHIDEVRNVDHSHYPFDHPTFEQLLDENCINWKDGKTTGLYEVSDRIHHLNYGACMCALREDLIDIGGADEHIDYLGHVCGPYDMTFRLVNHGKQEAWHEKEFLFHTWHPGSDGIDNYIGPHDGKNVSSRALEARQVKSVMPSAENEAIRSLRLGQGHDRPLASILDHMQRSTDLNRWIIDDHKIAVSLGRSAYYRHDFKEAMNHWRKFLDSTRDDPSFQAALGWTYYHLNNNDKSMTAFNLALQLDRVNTEALRGRGWLCNRLGRHDEAVKDFTRLLPLLDDSMRDYLQESYRGRGLSHLHLGLHDEAIADLSSAIVYTMPQSETVLHELYNTLAHVYLAKANILRRQIEPDNNTPPRPVLRHLKDTIRSHKGLYYIARHGHSFFRRVLQNRRHV